VSGFALQKRKETLKIASAKQKQLEYNIQDLFISKNRRFYIFAKHKNTNEKTREGYPL